MTVILSEELPPKSFNDDKESHHVICSLVVFGETVFLGTRATKINTLKTTNKDSLAVNNINGRMTTHITHNPTHKQYNYTMFHHFDVHNISAKLKLVWDL